MIEKQVILAVEDQLSQAVATRILNRFDISITQPLGLKGKGYLYRKAQSLNETARGYPVFMLTDQDSPNRCPPDLIRSWIKGNLNPGFLLRVAVMEIESWILADRTGIAGFLSIPSSRIPQDTDAIPQPKELLVSLARRSRKNTIREDLIPSPGSTSKIGPGYNSRFGEFVREQWNVELAASVSWSLKRTLDRLHTFSGE